MSETKLFIIILLAGLVALYAVWIEERISKLEQSLPENMICTQEKQSPVFIYLRCLKNTQEQDNATN